MWSQPFAMGVFVGMVLAFMLALAFLFWVVWDNRRYKSEMQERYYD